MEAFTDNHGGNLVLREFSMRMKMGERSELYDSPWPSEKHRTSGLVRLGAAQHQVVPTAQAAAIGALALPSPTAPKLPYAHSRFAPRASYSPRVQGRPFCRLCALGRLQPDSFFSSPRS